MTIGRGAKRQLPSVIVAAQLPTANQVDDPGMVEEAGVEPPAGSFSSV
jgi:hypothetical protein